MNKLLDHWLSYSLILIWVVVCIICQRVDLVPKYANKGLSIIGKEYYRFVTALFLHNNFLHMLANAVALYFVGKHLELQINPDKLFVFSLLIGVITEMVFSAIYKNSVSMGGSPIVFSLIGLIIALQIMKADSYIFQLGTWHCNWIVGYAILANIPLFSTSFVSTLIIHSIPMVMGIVLGCLSVGFKII